MSLAMLRNYFIAAYRSLFKNPLYTTINVAGLGIGLAACILILLYVRGEFAFERWIPDVERIYQVNTRFDLPGREPLRVPQSPGPVNDAMVRAFSEIESVGSLYYNRAKVKQGDKPFFERLTLVDADFLKIVPIPFLEGDPSTALADTSSVVLSKTLKEKYFGAGPALGKTLSIDDEVRDREFLITGVVEDPPPNSDFSWDLLGLFDRREFVDQPWVAEQWTSANLTTLVKFKPGADPAAVSSQLPEFEASYVPDVEFGGQTFATHEFLTLSLMPLRDVHLHAVHGSGYNLASPYTSVVTFAAIAFLILAIACINFMNLSTARASQRAREVSLRKVLGAHRRDLVTQFLGESTLLAVVALVLALVLVELALPGYNNALDRQLTLSWFDRNSVLPWIVVLVAFVGIAGGLYPAFYLSSFEPARVLKANRSSVDHGSSRFRGALVVTQFAIAIALTICTAVVFQQYRFTQTTDIGFDRENVLVVRGLWREAATKVSDTLVEELQKTPGVVGVTRSSTVPGDAGDSNAPIEVPGASSAEPIVVARIEVDFDFFETYGVDVLEGRVLDRRFAADRGFKSAPDVENSTEETEVSIMLNESGVSYLGFATPQDAVGSAVRITAPPNATFTGNIVGVVENFHFKSIRQAIRPSFYFRNEAAFADLSVRFQGDPAQMVEQAEAIWRRLLPGLPFQSEFLDDHLADLYQDERSRLGMFGAFSLLAIVIACLGLYGLASFSASRRTKEIGIRKVLGASTLDVIKLLVWQFSKPVLIANVIAWPVAALVMWDWLQGFQYRVALEPWIFGLAAILALSIAWSTISGHALRFARTRPSHALRYE
ncbi:MAG: ABC transporter permease [Myxococcota bacterium]